MVEDIGKICRNTQWFPSLFRPILVILSICLAHRSCSWKSTSVRICLFQKKIWFFSHWFSRGKIPHCAKIAIFWLKSYLHQTKMQCWLLPGFLIPYVILCWFSWGKIDLHTTDGILITFKTTILLCRDKLVQKWLKENFLVYIHTKAKWQ